MESEVAELLRRAQEVDDEEDRRYGKDQRSDELPEELAFRESRLKKIREAKAALESEAREAAEEAEYEGRKHPGVPDDKDQRNFTDPESRIMPGPGGRDFQQAYHCQAVVDDAQCQVIVAAEATNRASDKQQGVVMVEQAIGNTGAVPKEVSAEAGYYSAKAVEGLSALGVDPSSHRIRLATARQYLRRPGDAYPPISPPGTGCGGSCERSGADSATGFARRRWSRCSVRSSRGGASGSSCCGAWKRRTGSGP